MGKRRPRGSALKHASQRRTKATPHPQLGTRVKVPTTARRGCHNTGVKASSSRVYPVEKAYSILLCYVIAFDV